MISHVYEIIGVGYDISYDFICHCFSYDFICQAAHVISHMISYVKRPRSGSNAPLHPGSKQYHQLLVPYVCLCSLASKSGCSGLLIPQVEGISDTGPAPPKTPSPLPLPQRPISGIAGPADVRGNHNQAGKLGEASSWKCAAR